MCERFPGYTIERIAEELDEEQLDAMIAYVRKYPTPSVRMVEWESDRA